MEAELNALNAALGNPVRPVAALVGGAKVSTKLELLSNLIEKVDHLIIGGGMANTFLVAGRRSPSSGRTRHGRHRARDHGKGQKDRLRDPSARRRGGGARIQRRVPPMRCCPTRNARPMR